jgi:hypothetical protein
MALSQGWVNMAPRVNEALLNAMPRTAEEWLSAKGEPITVEHRWTNPGGRNKTTAYTFDFDTMTQTNGDSGTRRQIRLIRMAVLRSHGFVGL